MARKAQALVESERERERERESERERIEAEAFLSFPSRLILLMLKRPSLWPSLLSSSSDHPSQRRTTIITDAAGVEEKLTWVDLAVRPAQHSTEAEHVYVVRRLIRKNKLSFPSPSILPFSLFLPYHHHWSSIRLYVFIAVWWGN